MHRQTKTRPPNDATVVRVLKMAHTNVPNQMGQIIIILK